MTRFIAHLFITDWAVTGRRGTGSKDRLIPPENGGSLAASLRRRPSATHAGTASGSAPASQHKTAA